MAFNLTFRILQSHKSTSVPVRCRVPVTHAFIHYHPPMMKPFGLTMKNFGTDPLDLIVTNFDGWSTASGISGYRKFLITGATKTTDYDIVVSIPASGPYPEHVAIEEFATDAGAMDGYAINAVATSCRVTAMHAGSSSNRVTIRADIYHRDSGGTETLIAQGSSDVISNTTMTAYDFTVVLNKKFETNDRLVAKYIAQHTDVS